MALLLATIIVALVLSATYVRNKSSNKERLSRGASRLPGPKGLPLIGRVHDVPAEKTWLKFYEWSKEFGPIYQQDMFGSVHIWISSEEIAHELLSRRAATYSDRPMIPNLPNNRYAGEYLALHGSNETWKRQRKLAQQLMSTSANASLHDYPTKERDRFLYLLSQDPSQYREYIEQFTARTVSRLSWGSTHPANVLRKTTLGLLETISPAGALPNVISWLRHMPYFLSPWKQREFARHEEEAAAFKSNVRYVHERINIGDAQPSFVKTFISRLSKQPNGSKWGQEAEATYVVGQMAIAGALTIGSPIQSFLLAMLHYPDWQRKLQAEIDDVCHGECPAWIQREKMPLLRAVVKEVIRWRPPVPTGIPHATEADDVWNGYFIPKGATIHALEWGITRDENTYPDAEAFNPARWLEPEYPTYKEPLTQHPNLNGFSQFGFGRRTCQGVPVVEQDLFLAMGGMSWAFNIRKKHREDGSEVDVHWDDFSPLLIAKPAPFEFDALPRSEFVKSKLAGMWETGKGDDDIENEKQQALGKMMAEDHDNERNEEEHDVVSIGGSDTSGPSEGASESSGGSGANLEELDIWA
ncbi:putative Cytochrome P450 [Seiridium cardinale]|uniref:Cytochrome P450 n=1 Tax=Seiridium cardinale TaxID=138064 RepID=A0ABR2XTS3_9PEZI